jgi:adenosine deaminase CECR1
MPKGALLHAHLDATVNAERLYALGLEQPTMHIWVGEQVNAGNVANNVPRFLALKDDQCSDDTSLGVTTHARTFIQLQTARNNFPAELGGIKGFDKWVLGSMMISPSEAYRTHNTVKKVTKAEQLAFIPHG